jgi:hypothetical protein
MAARGGAPSAGRLDCGLVDDASAPPLGPQSRAISHLCFGGEGKNVLDDVGVRFGGSEHHRI